MTTPTIRIRGSMLGTAFALAAMLWAGPALAEAPRSAKVSYLEGKAWRTTSAGARAALVKDGEVLENETVETESATRVELRTMDGSSVRVGPSSKLVLRAAYFGAAGDKKFSAKLFFGQVWTKVSGVMGPTSKFEVETDNAVAGVRGTTFRIDAREDKSVVMKVYAGAVAMASSKTVPQKRTDAPKGGRKQVGGPTQVSAAEWEKLVGAMMQISVNADGTAGDPVAFKASDDAGDDWALWNQLLDEKQGGDAKPEAPKPEAPKPDAAPETK